MNAKSWAARHAWPHPLFLSIASQSVRLWRTKQGVGWMLALAAFTLFYCRDSIFFGRIPMVLNGDEEAAFYSSLVFLHEWAGKGVFPLWETMTKCGQPYGLFSVSIYDLFHLAALVVSADLAYAGVKVLNFFLTGWIFGLFLLKKGISRFAAGLAGALWAVVSSQGGNPEIGFFFFPLAFLAAEEYLLKKSGFSFIGLTATLALFYLNSNPQVFLYVSIFLFFYMVFHPAASSARAPRFAFLALPFVLAAGLTVFYFARMFELAVLSNRDSWGSVMTLLPTHAVLTLFPKAFNIPLHPELDFMVPRIFQGLFSRLNLPQVDNFPPPPYLGILAVVSLILCCHEWRENKDRNILFFLVAIGAVFAYLVFHPFIYFLVVRHIPFLKGMTSVTRLFHVYAFSAMVLTAMAVDSLMRRSAGAERGWKFAARVLGGASAVFFAALLAVRFFLFHFRDRVLEVIGRAMAPEASLFIPDQAAFRAQRSEEFFLFFKKMASAANPHLWVPAALMLALFLLIYLYQRKRLGSKGFQAAIVLFAVLDLFSFYGFAMPTASHEDLWAHKELADEIKKDTGVYRVMVVEDKTGSFSTMFLRTQTSLTYGLATPDGYEQLYIKRYVRFYTYLTRRKSDAGYVLHPMHDFDPDLADLINCKYILTNKGNPKLDGDPGYEKAIETPRFKVYRNLDALPRAFAVRRYKVAASPGEAEAYLRDHPGRLREEALLEREPERPLEAPRRSGPDQVSIKKYEPNRVEIETDLAGEAYVVLSDTHYPGWKAAVDGKRVPIELANYTFRAVRMPAGSHELEFRYEPDSLRRGLWASVFSAVLLLVLALAI